jgi:hypothetical protein
MKKIIETVGELKKQLATYNDTDKILVELPDAKTSMPIQGVVINGSFDEGDETYGICIITAIEEDVDA